MPAGFEALIQDIRPELHRYCARMIGSVMDAEDLVQEALAKAYAALPAAEVANVRAWLFRIAHNKAIDYLRRTSHQQLEYLDKQALRAEPDPPLAGPEMIALALSLFLQLAPKQRSGVILKDVLGYSLAAISELLDATIPRSRPPCIAAARGCASYPSIYKMIRPLRLTSRNASNWRAILSSSTRAILTPCARC